MKSLPDDLHLEEDSHIAPPPRMQPAVDTECASDLKACEKECSRLAAIIEHSNESVISKTLDGIIIGWNHGAEKQYGYTAEEIIGHSISVLFPPEHYQEYLGIMKRVRNDETVESFDTVRLRKDGTPINVSVSLTPIEARDGHVIGASKISHDITKFKKLEAQFIEVQKMEVVGQLAGGVAHDFNNLLAVIMGYSEVAKEELGDDHPVCKHIEEIQLASERASGLTRQLLVFSRREIVHPVVLDLNGVVKDLNKMLGRLIDENIEMTVVAGDKIGAIQADPGYLGQVLMNLVVNARDAMPDGGKITIATTDVTLNERPGVPSGDYVMLSVSDTGTGMTDEVKTRLFESFFTTKPKGKGTGLGLATCQTIVKLSGGHIVVSSQLGKGTTFEVYFPRVDQPLTAAVHRLDPETLPRGTETLLVVEDERSLRNLACSVLQGLGYNVLAAANGQAGLKIVHEHKGSPIRLVITDGVMPLMSGKVMVAWLKTSHPNLKILFTSVHTDSALTDVGVPAMEGDILSKPYTPATLARKVREMLDR